jgi:hypothetical protein
VALRVAATTPSLRASLALLMVSAVDTFTTRRRVLEVGNGYTFQEAPWPRCRPLPGAARALLRICEEGTEVS